VTGHVSLVGAGPGDPGLLTRTAIARLRAADLVLYDALVDGRILRYARRARRFYVGKRAGRHAMSQTVRDEATRHSREWGYEVGSVYVRKVHFRDAGMIAQIEQKVVNRLRQVTAAIEQDGANRVNVIRSASERQAAVEFAKAAALRPRIVGEALARIADDPEISQALFEVLETQNVLRSPDLRVTLVPPGATVLVEPPR